MSAANVVPFAGGKVPAILQNAAADADDLSAGVTGGFAVVSFRGSKWRVKYQGEEHPVLNADGDPIPSLEVVILKAGRIAASCDLEAERRANRSFVELELQQPGDGGFVGELQRLGCELAVIDDRRRKLVLPAEVTGRDLYRAADQHWVAFRRLDCKRDSLQDIFVRAMEDDRGGL